MSDALDLVAERVIALVPGKGHRRLISLKVGRPLRTSAGAWACPVVADGLFEKLAPIHGEDSWQALMLAQQFLLQLLKTEVSRGAKLVWADSEEAISLDQLFCVAVP